MTKLYKKSELWFSIVWIIVYVVGASFADEISRSLGTEKLVSAPFLLLLCAVALDWMKKNGLFRTYGLCKTDVSYKKFLYFLPLAVLVSCNFWHGTVMGGTWIELVLHCICMLCIGFLEELIFRGFLFRAMAKDGIKSAIAVSSITFGIGHIVNLFNGSGATLLPNLCQVISAIAFGFLFVILFYRGKSLLPCILAHQFINVTSFFANESAINDEIRVIEALVLCLGAVAYSAILIKILPKREG